MQIAHRRGQQGRDGINIRIMPTSNIEPIARGLAHLIKLNYTLLFMENYKSNRTAGRMDL